nr:PDZ and C2 calcium-dependent membrane targeting domain containing protein [Haemonchus contortus]
MDDPSLMPDLSHLSAEEREIIEQVFKRQKDEEAKEVQLTQKADAELDQIEKQINERKEIARRLVGTHDDAICQICQKTKFADGIGHKCFYCQLRSCARCGGRSQSKSKAIWACSLCQKRQQILAKTGKWFQPDEAQHKLSNAGQESPCQSMSPTPSFTQSSQPAVSQPAPASMPVPQAQRADAPKVMQPSQPVPPQQQSTASSSQPAPRSVQEAPRQGVNGPSSERQRESFGDMRRQNTLQRQPSLTDEQCRQQGNGALPQQQSTMPRVTEPNRTEPSRQRPKTVVEPDETAKSKLGDKRTSQSSRVREDKRHKESRPVFYTEPESNRFEDRKSDRTDINLTVEPEPQVVGSSVSEQPGPQDVDGCKWNDGTWVNVEWKVNHVEGNFAWKSATDQGFPHAVPSSYTSDANSHRPFREDESHRRMTTTHATTVAEVQSVPPVASGTTHRGKKNKLHRQIHSMSSSEDELPSTSAGFGEEEVQRVPNECTSEKDLLRYIYGSEKVKNGRKSGATVVRHPADEPRASIQHHEPPSAPIIPGDMLAAKIRTYLSHPVTWQPSADQRRLIGHMVLHKTDNSASGDLGLKVVGGRRSDNGRLGAFITRVKPGSVADTIGRLRAGDEVLEWNGQALQNATFDQVYEIISASKHESQVEIIVSRSSSVPGGDDFLNMQTPARQLPNLQYFLSQDHEMFASPSASPLLPLQTLSHSQSAILPHHQQISPRHRTTMTGGYFQDHMARPEPRVSLLQEQNYGRGQIFGRIEISLYFSHVERQLTVRIERVADLPPRADGSPRNPYVKIFLLPDRSEKSRRQTTVLAEAITPIWNESFYYQGITEPMLMERVLEVTVWDYDKFEANSFLGETLVDFSTTSLDGQTMTLPLVDMDDENPLRLRFRNRKVKHYHSSYQRPRSEMSFVYNGKSSPYTTLDPYADSASRAASSEAVMRRSRTYEKPEIAPHGGGPLLNRMDEDWSVQPHSGYLSDHGYYQQSGQRVRHRRPRSATAMRPMTASEMGASRAYYRNLPEQTWDDGELTPEGRYAPQNMSRYPPHEPHSTNGRSLVEMMQEQEQPQEYGSDGSETMSTHSAHSIPTVRTINRRCMPPNEPNDMQETSLEEYAPEDVPSASGVSAKSSMTAQSMKERKKSIMTRFIPGKSGTTEGKRTGFLRSEEVGIPGNMSAADRLQQQQQFVKQTSKESTDSTSDNWLPVLPDGPLGTFVDNLGPGQVVGRQVLASPLLGEIQIGIMAGRAGIDVEIIRAKNLAVKPGVKISPAPYVKVYLMEGKTCVAKAKTNPVRKTTAPLFQQHLIFNDNPKRKMLQVRIS